MNPVRSFSDASVAFRGAALALLGFGLLVSLSPELLAERFEPLPELPAASFRKAARVVSRAIGASALVAGGFLAAWSLTAIRCSPRRSSIAVVACSVALYLVLVRVYADWLVDDAAIIFAYSENLVRGYGLVLHPEKPPEEAYSSTLWVLILALARVAGLSIPVAAKTLCTLLGALTIGLTSWVSYRLVPNKPDLTYAALGVGVGMGSPFIVWSVSGLEHALQALLLLTIAIASMLLRSHLVVTAFCLSALVLLRPEAPLLVSAVFAVYAWVGWRSGGVRRGVRAWPVAFFPLLTWLGLLGFRLAYFGDPLPNPFYAKASDATFLRLLNVVGGGWGYVIDWARSSGALSMAPILAFAAWHRAPFAIRVAVGLGAAQIAFVIYAGGDWMHSWRFIAPVLPTLALIAVFASSSIEGLSAALSRRRVHVAALAVTGILVVGTVQNLVSYRGNPDTPYSIVARIGGEFAQLSRLLGLEDPTLAHHDAGGTSYGARLHLIDLAGLGSRPIAKHLEDPGFLRKHILEERKPDFVFGAADNFAAGASGFHETERFRSDYVRLRFPGRSYMQADLCHMRREHVRRGSGLQLVRRDGRLVEVVVLHPDAESGEPR